MYGNYQLTGRNLNLFKAAEMTEATRPVSAVGRWGGILGKASFGVGVGMDAIGVFNYLDNPNSSNAVHPAKAGLNTAMGYIFGLKFNPIAGALYFGVDAFYPKSKYQQVGGWQGYAIDYDHLQRANEAIVPGFITAPYGALKQ